MIYIYETPVPELKDVFEQTKVSNTIPPNYCIAKLFKERNPKQLPVSNAATIILLLARGLTKLLNFFLKNNFQCPHTNGVHALQKSCMTCPVMGFDTKALFHNVSLNTTLDFIEIKITKNSITVATTPQHFREFMEVFTQKVYCQNTRGLQLVSPLFGASGVMVNLFTEYFESELLLTLRKKSALPLRYVNIQVNIFLSNLNFLAPSIHFTHETENERVLPFLHKIATWSEASIISTAFRKQLCKSFREKREVTVRFFLIWHKQNINQIHRKLKYLRLNLRSFHSF